jgi:hypothetical protein
MASVYGKALLTIIAAVGKDANHGLPDLETSRTKYEIVDLGRFQIIRSHSSGYGQLINRTTWVTRAWTYQEMLLSPRSLVFLENHIEWVCKCTEWLEDHDFEHEEFILRRDYSLPGCEYDLSLFNYRRFISEYTRRNLTFENDIVNAFLGIMAAIDDKFFWDLPLRGFGGYLVWASSTSSFGLGELPDQRRDCGLSIPTWSWLSCKGMIDLGALKGPIDLLLAAYRWRSGQLKRMCKPYTASLNYSPKDEQKEQKQTIWYDDSEWTVGTNDIPSDVMLNEDQIIFWAFTVAHSTTEERKYALVGQDILLNTLALSITWNDRIATHLGSVSFEENEWPFERAVKKLMIMQ